MTRIHITAKRQATLPKELCDEMGVAPGDDLLAERRVVDGQEVWVLRRRSPRLAWVGSLRPYAAGRDHSPEAIRASAARGWAEEGEE